MEKRNHHPPPAPRRGKTRQCKARQSTEYSCCFPVLSRPRGETRLPYNPFAPINEPSKRFLLPGSAMNHHHGSWPTSVSRERALPGSLVGSLAYLLSKPTTDYRYILHTYVRRLVQPVACREPRGPRSSHRRALRSTAREIHGPRRTYIGGPARSPPKPATGFTPASNSHLHTVTR